MTSLYMRTTRGLERVHAVYRRLDDDFVDPLEFDPHSLLGVPGLVRAYRAAGSVAIANALGTGVADDKAIYRFVPDMIRFYLAEEPILDNVHTYLLGDPEVRAHVLERLDRLVVKPTGGSGGIGVTIGPQASDEDLARLKQLICANPERWVRCRASSARIDDAYSRARGRAAAMSRRPAPVCGIRRAHRHRPGRPHPRGAATGLDDRQLVRGGGSKDTWVLEEGDDADPGGASYRRHAAPRPARLALRRVDRSAAAAAAGQEQRQHAEPGP